MHTILALHVRNEASRLLMSYNTLLTLNLSGVGGLELPTSWSVDWLATICDLVLRYSYPYCMNNLIKYFSLIQFCI